ECGFERSTDDVVNKVQAIISCGVGSEVHKAIMERSLMEIIVNDTSGGGESILASMKFAVLPIAKVFTVCFLGFLMAPSSLVGLLVALIVRPPYPYFKFTIIHIGIGNIGNIPLVLIAALCRDKSNPFGDPHKCSQDGNAYISFGQWMLAPPPGETYGGSEEEKLPTRAPLINTAPEQQPLLTREEPETSPLGSSKKAKENRSFDGGLVIEDPLTIKYRVAMCMLAVAVKLYASSMFCILLLIGQLHYLIDKLKIKQILQPPIVASVRIGSERGSYDARDRDEPDGGIDDTESSVIVKEPTSGIQTLNDNEWH
ncbi:hypothetical protein ACMD2_25830, partial [Ananas comosus]